MDESMVWAIKVGILVGGSMVMGAMLGLLIFFFFWVKKFD